ncbi:MULTISPECIES: glycosyltransferase 87 family protein [Streptacidiphilus]|uniref:Glycosyltransferase 87 family protein n=1 Tax=Streptacidiphilus cavernicola TaxID=3342716 RepID=A0ABV6UX70_9ACTN|nr:glycosyltransferase 87 family protein [Streptacidiphilus jeojiense]
MATSGPATSPQRARTTVLLVGLAAAAAKAAIAATTHGTDDVRTFIRFARVIAHTGPVGVYGVPGLTRYNHGPLTGILLAGMSRLAVYGAPMPLLIRLPAILADLLTCLLVFELTRTRMGVRRARWCGTAVALSPVLVAVSGFHGNTDPVFAALTLLSAWLLTRRRLPLQAGIALGLALSIKIVPVVAVPALLIAAFRLGRGHGYRFAVALAATLAALWSGPMLRYPKQVHADVLSYAGISYRPWGLPHLAALMGVPLHWIHLWVGPGRFSVVLLAAATGAWIAWRRPQEAGAAVGLSLAAMLLFSTASAAQYLAWAAAGVLVAEFWSGLAYNLLAGAFLSELYARWSSHWYWDFARATRWTPLEVQAGVAVWASLAVALALGIRAVLRRPATVTVTVAVDVDVPVAA